MKKLWRSRGAIVAYLVLIVAALLAAGPLVDRKSVV